MFDFFAFVCFYLFFLCLDNIDSSTLDYYVLRHWKYVYQTRTSGNISISPFLGFNVANEKS